MNAYNFGSLQNDSNSLSSDQLDKLNKLLSEIQTNVNLPPKRTVKNPPTIYCIDGNIGSGKSTALVELKKRGYEVYQEDLPTWGVLLNDYYQNPKRWMCTFQIRILDSMRKQFEAMCNPTLQRNAKNIVFIERSPISSMLFVKNGIKKGYLTFEEASLIFDLYKTMYWQPDISIFLNTPADICHSRKMQRARECEKNVTLEDLQTLHEDYLTLYKSNKTTKIIDGLPSTNDIVDNILSNLRRS
jgi:deoxyadenosine/deoxycytidine kinase